VAVTGSPSLEEISGALRTYKLCSRCHRRKLIDKFPRSRSNLDGHYSYCLCCHAKVQHARRKEHPEEHRAAARKWRRLNPEKARALARGRERRRRARLRKVAREEFTLYEIYVRDEGICRNCGTECPFYRATVDHIIPLALGGSDTRANVQLAHLTRNQQKGPRVTLSTLVL